MSITPGGPINPQKQFYDQGWNDRCREIPKDYDGSTSSYRCGWRDCDDATMEHGPQQEID